MKPLAIDKQGDELRPPITATPDRKLVTPAAEISAVIDNWIDAWSDKDVPRYLSACAADFQPPEEQSREDWLQLRRSRIEKPTSIEVSYTDLQTTIKGGTATARFRQSYVSDSITATDTKELDMVRQEGRWLILRERVVP